MAKWSHIQDLIFGPVEQLDEAIRNFGRGSAGSAVRGGRVRSRRKMISRSTLIRKQNHQVLKVLRNDTKAKQNAADESDARREGQFKSDVQRRITI